MKSLGDTLKSAREERGISMDQAVHETNISRNYLEALEAEAFDEFPAEAYLVGFLRNYSDFLGLEPEKIVGQFRNYKLSEEPTPIEQLVGPPKGSAFRKIIPWILVALALAAAGVFGVPRAIDLVSRVREERAARSEADSEPISIREIVPSPPLWEGEVRPGDILILEGPNSVRRYEIGEENGRLLLDDGEAAGWSLLLGEEIYIPDAEGRPAWRLYLKDLGLPDGGGVIEIQQLAQLAPEDELSGLTVIEPPSGESERRRNPRVILSQASPDRFTLDVAFRDFCLFRYKVDSQDSLEAYYADGDNFRLDVGRNVTIWASNAGALYAKIGGEELSLGRRGEVVVSQIRWVANEETGAFDLTIVPLY
jgi:cytoskeleton protein RodZ